MTSERPRLLIVDDTPENIHVLKETLKDDYRILAATNGARALQLVEKDPPPDLILLDVMMPEMNGYEVMERLHGEPRTAGIPVVFVTALNDSQNEEHGLLLGAVDYITKPFNPALVKARVKNHIELKRHRDHLEEEVQQRTEELLVARHLQARVEGELATARRLQLSMLNPAEMSLGHHGSLAAYINPARSVGGDLFDYFRLDERRLLLCLGDVSDKGTGAALFMVKTLTLLRAFAQSTPLPDELLVRVNRSLCQHNEEFMFVTLTCCLLDLNTGQLSWASGGHEPLLKVGQGGGEFLEQETGPALGLMEEATFPLQTITLSSGEGLVLYSDGITEAQKGDGIEFGPERLQEAVEGSEPLTAAELRDRVVGQVDLFVAGAEQFDDMAVLAVSWEA